MSIYTNPFNPYGVEVDNVVFLQIFNKNAQRPADGERFERESAEYQSNTKATLSVALAFRAAAEKAGTQTMYPVGTAGLFWAGHDEICAHKDDLPKIMGLLETLKTEGVIDAVKEVPKEKSFHYGFFNAKMN